MKRVSLKQVDAFTLTPYEGNPACVVNDSGELSDIQMQAIAREMNVSETVFVLPSTISEADLQLKWFTPVTEVPLCGHATIAAFHSLAEDGLYGMAQSGNYKFNIQSKSGVLPIEVNKSDNKIDINFGLTIPTKFERLSQYKLDIVRILNLNLSDLEPRLLIVKSNYLYIPVRRLHVVYNMKPNFFALTNFLSQRNISGICVFTQETIDRDSAVHLRFFAPNEGISEDPVTGSAHGPLAVYLIENGMLTPNGDRLFYKAEQGDSMGRKGRVLVQVELTDGKPTSVKIGGNAVTLFSTNILVPY